MCVRHHFLGFPTEGQLLVLLYCAKVEIESTCYDNCNTFSFFEARRKRKQICFQNNHFDFLKIG